MGQVPVARVSPPGSRTNRARWIFHLHGITAFWKDERNTAHAELQCELALNDWLRKAGIIKEEQP
jgi:plasmid replication initiation protein